MLLNHATQERQPPFNLFTTRRPLEHSPQPCTHQCLFVVTHTAPQVGRKPPAALLEKIAIEHQQRLRRLRRHESTGTGCVRVGAVESRDNRHHERPFDVYINRAPHLLIQGRPSPTRPRAGLAGQYGSGHLGENTRAAHLQIQIASHGQDRIANRFGLESPRRETPKQLVARIDGLGSPIDRTGRSVDR